MTPADIVKVLTAAAPIVATVASAASKSETVVERKETPNITNNISVTYNNYIYTNSVQEAMGIASQIPNPIPSFLNSSENRYSL